MAGRRAEREHGERGERGERNDRDNENQTTENQTEGVTDEATPEVTEGED